jgi:hypothetical protein
VRKCRTENSSPQECRPLLALCLRCDWTGSDGCQPQHVPLPYKAIGCLPGVGRSQQRSTTAGCHGCILQCWMLPAPQLPTGNALCWRRGCTAAGAAYCRHLRHTTPYNEAAAGTAVGGLAVTETSQNWARPTQHMIQTDEQTRKALNNRNSTATRCISYIHNSMVT